MNEIHDKIKQKEKVSEKGCPATESEPFICRKYKRNEETGQYEIETIEFSDGSDLNESTFKAAVKRATGANDPSIGETILKKVAHGLSALEMEVRLNEASALLPALRPKDEAEAMLFGQFLALQDSGMKCLRRAHHPAQEFYHQERLFAIAQKLFNTANQTIQTLLRYRSEILPTMQIIPIDKDEKAIDDEELSSSLPHNKSEKKISN